MPLSELVHVVKVGISIDFETVPYIDISTIKDKGYIAEVRQVNKASIPARAKYCVRAGDVILSTSYAKQVAVAVVPPKLDGAVCSNALLVLRPHSIAHFALWGFLRSEQVLAWSRLIYHGLSMPQANMLALPVQQCILKIKPPSGFDELLNELAVVLPNDAYDDDYGLDLSSDWGIMMWEHEPTGSPVSISRQCVESQAENTGLRLDPYYLCSPAISVMCDIPYAMKSLGTLAEVVVGTPLAMNSEAGVPVLRARNIVGSKLDLTDVAHMGLLRAPVTISQNDMLVVLTGAATGSVVLVPKAAEGMVIDNNLARVRLHGDECVPLYVAAFLKSDIGKEIVRQQIIPGVTRSLPISGLANVSIPIPPAAEQNKIVKDYFSTEYDNNATDKEQKLMEFEGIHRVSMKDMC